MNEYVFRMTHTQLETIAGLMAGNGSDVLIHVPCGVGMATWDGGKITRRSWSFQHIGVEISIENLEPLQSLSDSPCCFFAHDKVVLEQIAFEADFALWGCLTDGNPSVFHYQNGQLIPVNVCCVVGHDLFFRFNGQDPMTIKWEENSELFERTLQAFGRGTTHYLTNLTVGIAGVSGTGSIVAEQLMRLGVKRLVLVDDDVVEVRNLGRILNSTTKDAMLGTNKAIMMKRAFETVGLSTEVIAIPEVIHTPEAIHLLSQCDILFGCLDSADGRMQLNRISTFYTIPYIDLGVRLKANCGRFEEISGAIRYIRPGGASLYSMGAYTLNSLTSDSLRRNDPDLYRARLEEKYVEGAHEGNPAVISVNMQVSSLGVLELLNRLHPFRTTPNEEVEVINIDMCEPAILSPSKPRPSDKALEKYVGTGDCLPLLGLVTSGRDS